MKESLRKASQESKLTARGKERAAKRLLAAHGSSSPRASLAFSALAVVRTLREMVGDLRRRLALGGTRKRIYGTVRCSSRS
jgi:hypothetical protein